MKTMYLQIPMSWEQDRVDAVVRSYEDAGFEVIVIPVAG